MSGSNSFLGHTLMKPKNILEIENLLKEVGYEFEKDYTLISLDKRDQKYPDNYQAKFKFTRPDGTKLKYEYTHKVGKLTAEDQTQFISWLLSLYYFELALCGIDVPMVEKT